MLIGGVWRYGLVCDDAERCLVVKSEALLCEMVRRSSWWCEIVLGSVGRCCVVISGILVVRDDVRCCGVV